MCFLKISGINFCDLSIRNFQKGFYQKVHKLFYDTIQIECHEQNLECGKNQEQNLLIKKHIV